MAISTGTAVPPETHRTPTTEERLSALGLDDRRRMVHRLLPLETGCGLEIAPNWAPVVTKSEGDVLYCDYLTYEQLLERERTNPGRIQHGLRVQRLDFIWEIGKTLQECAGTAAPFDYVVSCHVFEHVPNFLEYLYQVRAVVKDDGVIAMVLPDAKGSGEYFRRETNAAELINSYLLGQTVPSPGQVYDGLKNLFDFQNVPLEGRTLADVKRLFTDADSYAAALRASQEYVDVHCWAFSRDGFAEVARELREIGLFDFEIESLASNPATQTGHGSEFYVKLRPTAPPRPSRLRAPMLPLPPQSGPDDEPGLSEIERVRVHGDKAFREAVAVQDALKAEKDALEAAMARAVAHGEKAFREAVAAQDVLKAEKAFAENRLALLDASSLVKLGRRLGLLPR
jgi:SAM-dependent methyltransferase